MSRSFDDLARALAGGMPRRRVLKLFVTGLLGIAATAESPLADPPPAEAINHAFVLWPRPRDITYGTALGPRQLNAVAFEQGSPMRPSESWYRYVPSSGTVLSAGANQRLVVLVDNIVSPSGGPGYVAGITHITVEKDHTVLALSASSMTPPSGQYVTVTATIATTPPVLAQGAADPSGTVTFTVDGVTQPAVAVSNKQAQLKTGALTSGAHVIGAGYSGDGNFLGSAAQPITLHVG